MKSHPRFSVLMSVYIKEKASYFRDSMESILNQTVKPDEIVIVKDGPVSSEVEEVLNRFIQENEGLIKTVAYTPNRGLGYALGIGVEACSNELIARMDTDDIAKQDRFEKQLMAFQNDPTLDIFGSQIDEFEDTPGTIVAQRKVPVTDSEIKEYQKRRDAFNHMTVMYKRSAVLKAGNYLPCPLMEDTYLWARMILSGAKCGNSSESLVLVRIGEGMYKRRGGWKYFLEYREGRKKVLDTGYISKRDYMITLAIQLIVSLMPNKARSLVFKKILHHRA